jgi:HEAT repeat protein
MRVSFMSSLFALTLFCSTPALEAAQDEALYAAVKVAKTMMNSQDIYDRILAAGALADIGDKQALTLLEKCLSVDDTVVQRSAIDTLLTGVHPNSIDVLFKTAERDPVVLGLMAESLASSPREGMGELLTKALREQSDFVKKHALQALARAPGSGQDAAVQQLVASPDTSSAIRSYGKYVLLVDGQKDLAADFLQAAKSANADTREVAAVALGLVKTKESRAALLVLAKEDDQRVALAALASSAALGDADAPGKIIHTVAYGKPLQASVMAGALKRLPGPLALQITTTLFTCCRLEGDAATRLLESWGYINADASSVYAWGLAHKEADVRMQTLWLIGQRRDEVALARAAAFLGDEDAGIRGMAAWAIVRIRHQHYVDRVET